MATEMLAEVRVQDPRMTRIPAAQPLYTATATYKDEALLGAAQQPSKRPMDRLVVGKARHAAFEFGEQQIEVERLRQIVRRSPAQAG